MLRNILGQVVNTRNGSFFVSVLFFFFENPLLPAGRTRFSKTEKMDQFLTLKKDQFLTLQHIYMYMYMYIYIYYGCNLTGWVALSQKSKKKIQFYSQKWPSKTPT